MGGIPGARGRRISTRIFWKVVGIVVVFVAASATSSSSAVVGKAASAGDPILDVIARQSDVARDRLQVGDRATITLPLSGVTLEVATAVDVGTGKIYEAALDDRGRPVDFRAAQKAEESARVTRFGKLDPSLTATLDGVSPGQAVPVSIWVKADEPVSRPAGKSLSENLATLEAAMAPKRRGVTRELARMGVPAHEPTYSPVVFANLNPGQIRKIEQHPDVLTIYGADQNGLFQDDSATTERANTIWALGNLGFSTSSRPVIHEDDGVSNTNPFLNNAMHPVIFFCSDVSTNCPKGKNFITSGPGIAHASKVAGAVASTHSLFRGIAPSSQIILSANSQDLNSDAKNVDANEWARGNGGDPTNMSWGQICPTGGQNFMSRYVDWAERFLFQTFVIAAGNTRGCSTNDLKVSAPGLAWGPITVGAISDGNTGFWNNDVMAAFSRYQNPTVFPNLGQEKPEVVAVGVDQALTDQNSISFGNAGTSFAAPQVAGQVVDMLARRPAQNVWPETNKAAVLASAYHDIVAGTDQDGLGAVVMQNSEDTYRLGRFFNDCAAGCAPMTAANFPRDHFVSLVAGQVVKLAISWDTNSNGSSSDVLGANIALQVFRPEGSLLCSAGSLANAWQSCAFPAPVTGTYRFREALISAQVGWPGTFVGMAWSIRTIPDLCTRPPAISVPSTGGTFFVNTANGPTYFDSYLGWAVPQTGREQVLTYFNSTPHRITFTDTSSAVDLHILQLSSCAGQPPITTVRANGSNSAVIPNAAAGLYFLVGDSNGGGALADTMTVTIGPPG